MKIYSKKIKFVIIVAIFLIILISILIISNKNKHNLYYNEGLTSGDIKTFNAQFKGYDGNNVIGTKVRDLIMLVQVSNINHDSIFPIVVQFIGANQPAIICEDNHSLINLREQINKEKNYNVIYEYENNKTNTPRIFQIIIEENV